MSENISFRPVTPEDTDFGRQVHHQAFRDVVERQFGQWDEELQDRLFDEAWQRPGFQIVEFDGQPCGYYLEEDKSDEIIAGELAILPDFQGRGIGSTVLERLQDKAEASHLPIKLQVLKENEARKLYEKYGFRPYYQNDTHIMMEWVSKDELQ